MHMCDIRKRYSSVSMKNSSRRTSEKGIRDRREGKVGGKKPRNERRRKNARRARLVHFCTIALSRIVLFSSVHVAPRRTTLRARVNTCTSRPPRRAECKVRQGVGKEEGRAQREFRSLSVKAPRVSGLSTWSFIPPRHSKIYGRQEKRKRKREGGEGERKEGEDICTTSAPLTMHCFWRAKISLKIN